MTKKNQNEGLELLIAAWGKSAYLFTKECLGIAKVSGQQKDALDRVSALVNAKIQAHKHTKGLSKEQAKIYKKSGLSIMSGHGTGKDAFSSWVILWFLICFPNPKVICTAPTGHQLKDILWAECSKWMRNASREGNELVEKLLEWNTEKIYLKELKGKEWFAVARTCNTRGSAEEQAETLAGFHEDFMLFVVDEASGVPNPVYKPIEGAMTGFCNLALIIFNPTRSTGKAIDTQRKEREYWECLHWNAEESELVSKDNIDRMKNKYGVNSNSYRIRVLGLPPKSEEGSLIPWDWVQAAIDREVIVDDDDVAKMSCDVGGGGDRSTILNKKGMRVEEILENNSPDTMQVVGWIALHLRDSEPDATFTDVIGLGKGVYDRLLDLGHENIYGVNVSNSANDPSRFVRLRDELWWRVREDFERGTISIPNDDELVAQLTNIKYATDTKGRVKVESKKEMRLRGVSSPDKADALMMTYYMEDRAFAKHDSKIEDRYFGGANRYNRRRQFEGSKSGWMSA